MKSGGQSAYNKYLKVVTEGAATLPLLVEAIELFPETDLAEAAIELAEVAVEIVGEHMLIALLKSHSPKIRELAEKELNKRKAKRGK